MKTLNNGAVQHWLKQVPGATIIHTAHHTVVTRDDYSVYVEKVPKGMKARSHKILWDEDRHYAPLNMEHLKLRAEVSFALGNADER